MRKEVVGEKWMETRWWEAGGRMRWWQEHGSIRVGWELQRLLAGAGTLHGRKVDNDLGALHGRMKSRHHQDWEIST